MVSKYRLVVICAVLGVLGGMGYTMAPHASPPAITPTLSFNSIGHWDVVRWVDYDSVPEENLKGEISPPYRIFLVSLTGFHTDAFGIAVGPDDDVRYTTDGGQSWTKAAGELYCRHGLDIVDENVAWHCGNGGTRVSTDSGQTWQTVASSACPSLSFLDAQTGWAASPLRLQATADGGASWNTLALPLGRQHIAAVALRTAGEGYVLGTTGDLFVTADGGQSWEVRSLGLNPGEQLMAVLGGPYAAMRFLDARHGMVVFDLADGTVWFAITRDGGQSWQRAEIPDLRDQSSYYHLYLSRDGHLFTATDDFNGGANVSVVLRYREP